MYIKKKKTYHMILMFLPLFMLNIIIIYNIFNYMFFIIYTVIKMNLK